MISDNYMDETAEMLQNAGYRPRYISDIIDGSEIAIMHKDFSDGEKDVVEFYTVEPGIHRSQLSDENGLMDNYIYRFVGRNDKGILKHQSYNGDWGIYIKVYGKDI